MLLLTLRHSSPFSSTIFFVIILLSATRIWNASAASDGGLGIPGTTQTDSGYDTELGEDPMCWSSFGVPSASPTEGGGIAFPNSLVEDFKLEDHVQLLSSCPDGTWLEARAPPEFSNRNFRPRTLQWYNYTVSGRINLASLDGTYIVADQGSKIAISIAACDSATAGFCSPFVHEQSNIRLERERDAKLAKGIAVPPLTPTATGDHHGGTHVHSPTVIVDVDAPTNLTSTTFDFEVEVPMIVNNPGNFFVIGTLQFFTGDSLHAPFHRYDVANALKLNERLVVYQEPAVVLEVTEPVLLISYVAIGLASVTLLTLIILTIKYRNRQVLRLSQGNFLIIFLLAALVAAGSCVLFQPRNDLWCNLCHPMIIISLHLFFSVALARLWRINAVVSPVLKRRIRRANSGRGLFNCGIVSGLWDYFKAAAPICRGRSSIRRQVSPRKSYAIVFACCLPQVVLQVLAWLLQPSKNVVEYNMYQSYGRSVCSDGQSYGSSLQIYSLYLLLLLLLILVFMGHLARNLPSLLNESAVICDTAKLSVLLAALGGGVIAVTNAPTTSPDVTYLVKVFLVLTVTVNSSLQILGPKLKMAWSNESIIVSELVSADNRISRISASNSHVRISGVSGAFPQGIPNQVTPSFEVDEDTGPSVTSNDDDDDHSSTNMSSTCHKELSSPATKDERQVTTKTMRACPSSLDTSKRRISIRQGKEPSKMVVLRMIDLQHELEHVNKQVMSGRNVGPQDWQSLRKLTERMNGVFQIVDFDFEEQVGGASKTDIESGVKRRDRRYSCGI